MGLMGTGTSLILIAAGAILAWAINYSVAGVDVTAVGVILMVVGAIGLLMSLLFWSSFAPFGSRASAGDRKSTRLNSSHGKLSRMPSSA